MVVQAASVKVVFGATKLTHLQLPKCWEPASEVVRQLAEIEGLGIHLSVSRMRGLRLCD